MIFTDVAGQMGFFPFRRWTSAALCGILLAGGSALIGRAQSMPDSLDAVRVRLHHQSTVDQVDLTIESGPLAVRLPDGGDPVMRLKRGETITLGVRQGDVYLRRGGRGLYATELTLRPTGSEATWRLSLDDRDDRTYPGSLHLAPAPEAESSLLLVNEVPIERYVASVVASEYGLDDREGTKAMAVVARTYGLFASAKFGEAYDQADGTVSQVYDGLDAVTDASRQVAATTKGEVLTYNGNLIQAVYFSSSGGHTADNEDVWKADEGIPYLRGRKDPYDADSPHHDWQARVNRSALLQALTRHRGTLVEGFTIGERVPHGRVKTVTLLLSEDNTETMRANTFRLVVNRGVEGAPLKSTWFDARRQGDQYVFDGHGFGHGVGLSQYGAHAMARQGRSYREILQFYYTGVDIESATDVEFDPATAPVAQEPTPDRDTTERRIGW